MVGQSRTCGYSDYRGTDGPAAGRRRSWAVQSTERRPPPTRSLCAGPQLARECFSKGVRRMSRAQTAGAPPCRHPDGSDRSDSALQPCRSDGRLTETRALRFRRKGPHIYIYPRATLVPVHSSPPTIPLAPACRVNPHFALAISLDPSGFSPVSALPHLFVKLLLDVRTN